MNGRSPSTMFKNKNEDDDLFLNDIGSLSQIYDKRELYRDRFKRPTAPKNAYWDHKKAVASKAPSGDKTPARSSLFDDDDDDLYEAHTSDKRTPLYEQTPRRFEPDDDYEPVIEDTDDDDHNAGDDDFEEQPRLLASSVNNYVATAADLDDLPWRKPKTKAAASTAVYDFEKSTTVRGADGGGTVQKSRSGDDFSIEKASFGKWYESEEQSKRGGGGMAEKKAAERVDATELLDENYPNAAGGPYDAAFKHKPVKLSLDSRMTEERNSQNGSLFGFKQREFGGADNAAAMPTPRRPQLDDDDVVIVDAAEAKAPVAAGQSQQRRSRFSEDVAAQSSNAAAQYSFATPTTQASAAQQHIPTLYPAGPGVDSSATVQGAAQSTTSVEAGSRFVVPQTAQPTPSPQIVPPPSFAGADFRRPPGPPQGPPPGFIDTYRNHVSVRYAPR